MNHQRITLLVPLLLLALLLAACGAQLPDGNESQPPQTAGKEAESPETAVEEPQPEDTAGEEAPPPEADASEDPLPDLSERVEFTNFGFSIAYPAGWLVATDGPATIINELAEDHESALMAEPPPINGYAFSLDHRDMGFMRGMGLPQEPTVQDLFELNSDFFGWADSLKPTETELFGAPALMIKAQSDEDWTQSLMGFVNEQAFLLALTAPTEEALDAFLPTWDRMLESIEPTASTVEETPVDAAAAESVVYELVATTPVADFGFTLPYPGAWYAETTGNQLTISSTESQLDPPLTQPPIDGYSIDFFYEPVAAMQSGGLTADPTPQDVLDFLVASFGAETPAQSEKVTQFDVPAVRARSTISFEGEPAHPFEVTTGLRDDHVFVMVLHAPDETQLDAFIPSWREMVAGIQPANTNSN